MRYTKNLGDTQLRSASNITNIVLDTLNLSNFNLSGLDLSDVSMSGCDVKDVNFEGSNLSGVNLSSAKHLTGYQLRSATNVTDMILCYTNLSYADLSKLDFSNTGFDSATMIGAKFDGAIFSRSSLYDVNLKNATFFNATLSNLYWTSANLKNTDLRGAKLTDIKGTAKTQNTIWTDGEIKNFAMESVGDNLTIRKYVPATSGGATINAKIADDASISGGAVLTLEQGAVLEIASGKTLSVLDDSEIIFNVDAATDATKILLGENSKLVFGSDSKITINLDGVASSDDSYTFSVIESAAGAQVMGTDSLKKENVILNVNGETFDSSKWTLDFDSSTGSFNINVNVPEPAEYAAILGAIAIAFALKRRCSRK